MSESHSENSVPGEDNKQILIRANYRHYLHHILRNGAQMWICTLSKTCGARLKILGNQILREDAHKCRPGLLGRKAFTQTMQKMISNSHTPITKAYKDAVKDYVDSGFNLVKDVPRYNSVKSSLYRLRNKMLGVSKTTFKNPKDVEIPELFKDFILFDYNKEIRIIAFATEEGRSIMQDKEIFFLDGTFKCKPTPFYQIYSIHADLCSNERQTNVVPLVFALLPDKTLKSYEILLQSIKDHLPNWKPKKCILDFELAAINAITSILPDVVIKGCNFHYNQALQKNANKIGISSIEDKKHVQRCAALAHLPSTEIEEGWLSIMEIAPSNDKIEMFNDYFVNNWLDDSAALPKSLWCSYGERHRTNNLVESWHRKLNNKLRKNPRLLEFLFVIYEEAQYYCKYYHVVNNRSRQSINRDIKLTMILQDFINNKYDIKQTLEKLIGLGIIFL